MTTKIAMIGAAGRMGQAICGIALQSEEFEVVCTIDWDQHPDIGKPYSQVAGLPFNDALILGTNLSQCTEKPDVIIDFTSPASTLSHVKEAAEAGIAYVVGTTGMTEEDIAELKQYKGKIPVLLSPNMSLGVNILFEAAKLLTKALGNDYDLEIIEAHHNKKKDSPSGTAIKLFEVVRDTLGWTNDTLVHGREGIVGERPKKEIGMHAVRAGGIVGEHTLLLGGPLEQIELTHRAQSRNTFAHGSLKCASYLKGKAPGFYDMKSVLGIE